MSFDEAEYSLQTDRSSIIHRRLRGVYQCASVFDGRRTFCDCPERIGR